MNKRTFLFILIVSLATDLAWSQSKEDFVLWHAERKLSEADFLIKTGKFESTSSFGQFSFDYQISGFDFMTRNYNKKVRNVFIRSASWIDTTTDVKQVLAYQQTLFDICEIYTRHFRRALKDNRKKIVKGTTITEELNKQFVTDFARRRIEYDRETNLGADSVKQKEWEVRIQQELEALAEYAYDK